MIRIAAALHVSSEALSSNPGHHVDVMIQKCTMNAALAVMDYVIRQIFALKHEDSEHSDDEDEQIVDSYASQLQESEYDFPPYPKKKNS